jgi:hypothetical protein
VHIPGLFVDVDARRAPRLGRLLEHRQLRRLGEGERQNGNTVFSKFPFEPCRAQDGEALRLERTSENGFRVAAADSVFDRGSACRRLSSSWF